MLLAARGIEISPLIEEESGEGGWGSAPLTLTLSGNSRKGRGYFARRVILQLKQFLVLTLSASYSRSGISY